MNATITVCKCFMYVVSIVSDKHNSCWPCIHRVPARALAVVVCCACPTAPAQLSRDRNNNIKNHDAKLTINSPHSRTTFLPLDFGQSPHVQQNHK